jgi:hypothetical protein
MVLEDDAAVASRLAHQNDVEGFCLQAWTGQVPASDASESKAGRNSCADQNERGRFGHRVDLGEGCQSAVNPSHSQSIAVDHEERKLRLARPVGQIERRWDRVGCQRSESR